MRYEYDPRRAAQLLEELGYTRGPDGVAQNASGQKLAFEVSTTPADLNQKTILSIADYLQRAGMSPEIVMIPTQRARDLEYRATFPGFSLTGARNGIRTLRNLHSTQAPLPSPRGAARRSRWCAARRAPARQSPAPATRS